MEQEFILALITAIIVFVLTLVLGNDISALLKSVGAVIVVLPIAFYFLSGTLGMLHVDPETAQAIADSTVSNIINYVTAKLPSIVISDVAGAIVGTVGGFFIRAVKGM
ncbi:hypothetical protein ACFLXU_01905 [Chloroflexota bacterium]